MSKRRRTSEYDGWYEDDVAISTTLTVSQDEQRIHRNIFSVSEETYAANSSDYDEQDHLDDFDEGDDGYGCGSPIDVDIGYGDNDGLFSYHWGSESTAVENDMSLQALGTSQDPDSARIKVRRARNIDSVCLG
ncbi:hypothetical protein VKT23_018461 [Stygiomarasmius scandens]|uniref:Uncharacterized protein n=1 Tax=Marasmiellus scandens TaxID=2682957 RepID=A0ABR1IT81_9AGAR